MNQRHRFWLSLATIVCAASLSQAQTAPTLKFFALGSTQLNDNTTQPVAQSFELKQRMDDTGKPLPIWEMGDGSVRQAFVNGQLHVMPDLRNAIKNAPTADVAKRMAMDFLSAFHLLPDEMAKLSIGQVNTWSRQGASRKSLGSRIDPIRSVHFVRTIDGIPVKGPSSILSVDVDVNGVAGLVHSIHPVIGNVATKPELKSPYQLSEELKMQINLFNKRDGTAAAKQVAKTLIYYEQGGRYLQPAWQYDVLFTDSKTGVKSAVSFVIAAANNGPEVIDDSGFRGRQPVFPEDSANRTGGIAENLDLTQLYASTAAVPMAKPALQANPVLVGEYIVREDHHCWLEDANAFWGNLSLMNTLTFWHPHVTRRDYYWDYPWLWESALGIPDNSPYYTGQNHFDLIEGHGAPWLITCYKDYGEVIHLNGLAGFGANRGFNEKTAYIMWQSCDVIPEPGHPYEADFSSGSAFDVWWNVFKGMRANFGYRTIMRICNGVGGSFGTKAGLGFQNVSAWLDSTDHNVFGHSNGWDYGSCVIVAGHEGDTFYNNAPLANPSVLTMWWIH